MKLTRPITRPFTLAALALTFANALLAASVHAEHVVSVDLHFRNLSISDGLAQNSVYAIAQDRQGLLWFGTEDGLHRYDGYRFTLYRKSANASKGLQSSSIAALLVDSRGDLWIGTYAGGLHRMDLASGDIHPLVAADGTRPARENIWQLTEDRDGRIWFTGSEGPGRVEPQSDVFHRIVYPGSFGDIPSQSTRRVVQDSTGIYWFGGENLLAQLDASTGTWRRIDLRTELQLADDEKYTVTAMTTDANGSLTLTAGGQLLRLDSAGNIRVLSALPRDNDEAEVVIDLLAADDGLWLATKRQGLLHFTERTQTFAHYRHDPVVAASLSGNRLTALFQDAGGLMWIGLRESGVDRFDPATLPMKHFRHHPLDANSLSNNTVWMFARHGNGPLWVATNNGLNRVDLSGGKIVRYHHDPEDPTSISSNRTGSVRIDENGVVWLAAGHSLNRYLPHLDGFEQYPLPGGEENGIVNFLPLGQSRFILSTYKGLQLFDARDGSATPLVIDDAIHPELAHATTFAFARGADGRIWLGTDFGLLSWNEGDDTVNDVMQGDWATLFGNEIQDLTVLHNGRIAIATESGLGILPPAPGKYSWFDSAADLPDGVLYGVLEDMHGRIWVSSNDGLARFDPATGSVDRFDASDGLQSEEFNGGAVYRDASGALYFGGINGFNAFHPDRLIAHVKSPTAVITRVTAESRDLFGGPPAKGKGAFVRWQEAVVNFEFAAADFAAPETNRFQVRLLPLQHNWVDIQQDHRSTYTGLSGGDYVFEVRAARKNGTWSDIPARLHFTVEEKPWNTWWAWIGYGLLLLIVSWRYLHHHGERAAAREKAKQEQQHRRWTESLYQLTASLARTLDETQIASDVVEHAVGMFTPDFGVVATMQGGKAEFLALHPRECDVQRMAAFVESLPTPVISAREDLLAHRLHLAQNPTDATNDCHLLAIPMQTRDGVDMLLLLGRTETAFSDDDAKFARAYASQSLVAFDKAALFAEAQRLATRDPLTGLANRRQFNERAETEFQRCRRFGRTFSLLMIDIDHFKQLNDKYGHEAGDDVLRHVGEVFAAELRQIDLAARYGGEEFVVCLPETNEQQAWTVAERLRFAIERLTAVHDGHLIRVTASIGTSTMKPDSRDIRELIRTADQALYAAKKGGRNKVQAAR